MGTYGEDLLKHCESHNCYTCDDNVLEPRLQRGMKHSNVNALYELAYHVKKGRVRVPVTLMRRLFETDNLSKAAFLLSNVTNKLVDIVAVSFDKRFIVLEVVEKENAGS